MTAQRQTEKLDEYTNFVMTDDGSTGLYNSVVNDIYHSSYGAMSEAREKFILPLNLIKNYYGKKELNVLDICYGIGYNTKALIKELLKTGYSGRVKLDALEMDRKLVILSPFITDGIKSCDVDYILMKNFKNIILAEKQFIARELSTRKKRRYFRRDITNEIKKYYYFRGNYNPPERFDSFLHNIYYQCISRRNKRALRGTRINRFIISPYFDDARKTVQALNGPYDIVFLDAFTPIKLPTLWSLQFFKELFRITSVDAMILTYSNSAAVRHAMIRAGFCVGKTFDKNNRPSGTVAAKNAQLIENPLDGYDLGLLETNAGVCFEDENLNNSPETILKNREDKKSELHLESSSQYIKRKARYV